MSSEEYFQEARQVAHAHLRQEIASGVYPPYAVRKVSDALVERYDLDSGEWDRIIESLWQIASPKDDGPQT